jgi:hypothetical protein
MASPIQALVERSRGSAFMNWHKTDDLLPIEILLEVWEAMGYDEILNVSPDREYYASSEILSVTQKAIEKRATRVILRTL